jgi:phage gp36-like protein
MPYSMVEDIKKMLPEELIVQLTDDEAAGSINQARVEEAIAQADAEIDSYCGERYSVPFASPPEIVRKLSVDIAIYNLYSRLVREMPGVRAERHRASVRQLEAISKGLVSLGVDPAPGASKDGRAETNRADGDNVFTRDKLKGF